MSNDLISRRALLEAIDSSFVTPILKINMREEHKAVSKIWEIIVNMPASFDKEKVIDELKANMGSVQGISGQAVTFIFSDGYYNGIKDAIEIVEKGGIK